MMAAGAHAALALTMMHVSLIALLLATATAVTAAAAAAPYNCSRFPNVLPEIHVEGDHYDVGFAVGRTFRAAIARQLAASGSFQHTLLPFYATKAGRAYYDTYFKTANDTFPGYVAEIQGMADGAGMPFDHLFLNNIGHEMAPLAAASFLRVDPFDPSAYEKSLGPSLRVP